tara:strand:- start:386 stop:859 length:474 start_codon:yes stop_codon:yes gene_type:complete
MLNQFESYLTFEAIYLWSSFGVLPFWLMLIFIPNSRITQIFVNSIIPFLILGTAYSYVLYQAILSGESISDIFRLYVSLDDLYTIFATESFLLFFWLHFLTINLFLGSWVSREGVKYNIPLRLIILPLLLIFLAGPIGIVLYWLIRIFYVKRLGFHE